MDKAHNIIDEKLVEIEKKLKSLYSSALSDMQKKSNDYFKHFMSEDEAQKEKVKMGEISEKSYIEWRKKNIMIGNGFTALKEDIAKKLLSVNEIAVAYINDELPEVYSIGYNALEKVVEGVNGYSFALTDANTIKNLVMNGEKSLLPFKSVNVQKDIRWNMKNINSQVLQGVVRGESIPKIAKRIRNVQEMNRDSSIRTARTIVTSAENKGRQDSYVKAESDGIILQKKWLSSNQPGRTRDWHFPNGFESITVDQDKPFVNGYGEIMYPGDPSAHPANVYNCRCSMAAVVKGFKKVQVENAMEEKQEYTQAEQDEFAALQKKYKNTTEVMLFGTEEEMTRYDYLLQKDKANAGTFDYYKKFQHQNIAESKLNGWRVEPTAVERDAISSYSRSGYLQMNKKLRFDDYVPDDVKQEISSLYGFLDKCETQDELYLSRGVNKLSLDKMFGGDGWRKNSNSVVGSVFTDKGFVSTTPYQGGGFGGDVVMYIKAPKGTKGAYIKNFAASSEEKEFLIQSDTSFVVRNIVEETDQWGDKKYKVFAEVIV